MNRSNNLPSDPRHEACIDKIVKRLEASGKYDRIERDVEIHDENGRVVGQVDLYAVRGNYRPLFEVKSTDMQKKRRYATKQLQREEKYRFPDNRVFLLYAHPNKFAKGGVHYKLMPHTPTENKAECDAYGFKL